MATEMMRVRFLVGLFVLGLATLAFAAPDKPIANVKGLTGDWRAIGGTSAAAIRIKPDGSYEGISANGTRTAGKITAVGGKASFQSANSAGSVTWSQEGGKDVLLFVRGDGRGSAKLERVK
jgi:hypothetical protein